MLASYVSDSEAKVEKIHVPLVGLGTYNAFKDPNAVAAVVKEAIVLGYRHFDLAKMYENEAECGAAINEAIMEGLVDRKDLFICSKLWCDDHDPDDVECALLDTLDRCGLSYLDNYMMHWPTQWFKGSGVRSVADDGSSSFKFEAMHVLDIDKVATTYAAMEALVNKGLTRSLGVANFDHILLDGLLKVCTIKPLTLQVEMHPYLAQSVLLDYCKTNDIHVVAYTPLGKPGSLSVDEPAMLEDPTVVAISQALDRTPAQVILRWNVQRNVSVIPKTLDPSRLKSNIDILSWCLSDDEMFLLDSLDQQYRYVKIPWFNFDIYDNRIAQTLEQVAHPELLNQPLLKEGVVDERGIYVNNFGREGKRLDTQIILKRGVIKNMGEYYKDVLPAECLSESNYVITDSFVDSILDIDTNFIQALAAVGVSAQKILIPADQSDDSGEASVEPYKTTDVLHDCVDDILKRGISKHTCIISVGGGVVNNMCGVLASMLYRGISLVHFTTTTMGMLDAALDFKQAVNHQLGKNLLGCYYAASKVIIDPDCVSHLSTRHVRNGIAEALKHAFCQSVDMMDRIVEPVRKEGREKFRDSQYIEVICKDCVEVKVPTLDHYHNSDFNEMTPQYGHAVGHAVESLSWYTKTPLLHGEAVAIGMCVSAEIALNRGLCNQATVHTHYDACQILGLPCFIPSDLTTAKIMEKMVYDKHFVKEPSMGLCAAIGLMATNPDLKEDGSVSFTFSVSQEELLKAFDINIAKREVFQQKQA